jgi:hypothetical protein
VLLLSEDPARTCTTCRITFRGDSKGTEVIVGRAGAGFANVLDF